jgi:hypothetical protein
MKGHFNKPLSAILTSLVMIFGIFSLVLPYQEAEAAHNEIVVIIAIITPGPGTIIYSQVFPTDCDPSCSVNLNLNNRDEKRFDRWCGPTKDAFIPAGQFASGNPCAGPGPWSIAVNVGLLKDGDSQAHNDNGITITVNAT